MLLFHSLANHLMGIPTKLFYPDFREEPCQRLGLHVIEQRADNRIIRPSTDYIRHELSKV